MSSSDEADDASGRRIGGYRVLGELGRGGMGVVYEAEEVDLGRSVALKVLPELFSADRERLDQFDREARTLARVQHPRIVEIYRVGRQHDTPYLAMELVRGKPLSAHLRELAEIPVSKRKPEDLPLREPGRTYEESAARLVMQMLDGVAAIHEHGIVHRDLKPDNVLITEHNDVKIADFGLAKDIVTSSGLTSLGRPRGTPLYMSPEQATGNLMGIDHRSDLFSIGVILYELLTGTLPFRGDSFQAMAKAVTIERPVGVRKLNRRVKRDLKNVVDRALEKDCEKRYPTARAFSEDLERYVRGEPVVFGKPSLLDRARRFLVPQSPLAVMGVVIGYVALPIVILFLLALQDSVATDVGTLAFGLPMLVCAIGATVLLTASLFHRGRPRLFPAVTLIPYLLAWSLLLGDALIGLRRSAGAREQLHDEVLKGNQASQPGEHHQHLAALVGEYSAKTKLWHDNLKAPSESTGRMTNRWVLGGRCLYGEYRGDLLGVPFEGVYLWSFDESKQRYIEVHADSSTTGMLQFEGVCSDDGKVIMMGAQIEDPSTGEPVELLMTSTLLSEKEFKYEFFTRRQGADVFKSREILLTRMP